MIVDVEQILQTTTKFSFQKSISRPIKKRYIKSIHFRADLFIFSVSITRYSSIFQENAHVCKPRGAYTRRLDPSINRSAKFRGTGWSHVFRFSAGYDSSRHKLGTQRDGYSFGKLDNPNIGHLTACD